ncbi:hypothetical protein O9993_04790 [Vibrio lentus]|nr:hypothetical protein [Vibrio lentus]
MAAIKASEAFSVLDRSTKLLQIALRDFELSGIGLPADEQHRYGDQ